MEPKQNKVKQKLQRGRKNMPNTPNTNSTNQSVDQNSVDHSLQDKDIEAITSLYKEMWNCMIDKDIEGLSNVCAETFVLHHMTGIKQNKEEFFQAVANGTLNYYSAKHDEIRVTIYDDKTTATLIGRSRVNAAVFGGGKHTWHLQGTFSVIKEQTGWKLAEEYTSTY